MDLKKPWQVHNKQDEALRQAAADDNLHVFAVQPVRCFDCSQNGRKFIACTKAKFWWEYSKMIRNDYPRHYYEVIILDKPCHMYFDLEFQIRMNTHLDGNKMVDDLIEFSCDKVNRDFDIKCSKENVLRLDSSTDAKFSQHLVFHLPQAAFGSNYDVGNFVSELCGDSDVANCLAVCGEDDKDGTPKKSIVDQAVYSKNRHFRLFQSTKKGSKAVLLRSDCCCFNFGQAVTGSMKIDEEVLFFASLISDISIDEKCKIKLLTVKDSEISSHQRRKINKESMPYQNSSPDFFDPVFSCPELEEFVVSLTAEKDKSPGYIGDSYFDEENLTVRYSIRGNRYCRNIKRSHKSNNVYYVAYLLEKVVMQRCYDRETCRQFYSISMRFPKSVGRAVNKLVEESKENVELADGVEQLDILTH